MTAVLNVTTTPPRVIRNQSKTEAQVFLRSALHQSPVELVPC